MSADFQDITLQNVVNVCTCTGYMFMLIANLRGQDVIKTFQAPVSTYQVTYSLFSTEGATFRWIKNHCLGLEPRPRK